MNQKLEGTQNIRNNTWTPKLIKKNIKFNGCTLLVPLQKEAPTTIKVFPNPNLYFNLTEYSISLPTIIPLKYEHNVHEEFEGYPRDMHNILNCHHPRYNKLIFEFLLYISRLHYEELSDAKQLLLKLPNRYVQLIEFKIHDINYISEDIYRVYLSSTEIIETHSLEQSEDLFTDEMEICLYKILDKLEIATSPAISLPHMR